MALSTDFNVDPYYDDYSESKEFYRVLFRPGYAVQAREVTQLQTILQKQIERNGRYFFEEGSVVLGCELNYDDDIKSAIADMKNVGSGRGAGATSGAKFIEQFTQNIPWVHIDIAGVTWSKTNSKLHPTGGTGFGVRLLNTYVKDFIE